MSRWGPHNPSARRVRASGPRVGATCGPRPRGAWGIPGRRWHRVRRRPKPWTRPSASSRFKARGPPIVVSESPTRISTQLQSRTSGPQAWGRKRNPSRPTRPDHLSPERHKTYPEPRRYPGARGTCKGKMPSGSLLPKIATQMKVRQIDSAPICATAGQPTRSRICDKAPNAGSSPPRIPVRKSRGGSSPRRKKSEGRMLLKTKQGNSPTHSAFRKTPSLWNAKPCFGLKRF